MNNCHESLSGLFMAGSGSGGVATIKPGGGVAMTGPFEFCGGKPCASACHATTLAAAQSVQLIAFMFVSPLAHKSAPSWRETVVHPLLEKIDLFGRPKRAALRHLRYERAG